MWGAMCSKPQKLEKRQEAVKEETERTATVRNEIRDKIKLAGNEIEAKMV